MLAHLLAALALPVIALAKECHPMDQSHPNSSDLFNCHRECNPLTEWCVPDTTSSTGWACSKAHKRGEAQPGQSCIAGGGTVFCSNCPSGYFCQKDGQNGGWECDPLLHPRVSSNSQSARLLLHALNTLGASQDRLCSPCVSLGEQALQILLNYVLNAGVVGSCSKLCSNLESKGAQTACNVMCDLVGIKEFVKALKHADLDPIYFCEMVHACSAAPDNAAMELVSVAAEPQTIAKGDTVQLLVQLNVSNASGVGEFGLAVTGPVSQPVTQRFLLPAGIASGQQGLGVKPTVQDDDSGDPPVVWQPGMYSFTFEVCQGECRSKHPHSKVFGRKSGNFTLKQAASIISV
eukprot:TRINITY_DN63000_c0_g1_i1.p1 TRINITY_DN63000_c0_g1~~TRINITY_DN63000_c0_g1_i1.p1  ORF type:complete len:348 (+),score=46.98 TRINITY_DN63000_c0_g1_i1:119-1162(+)